MSDQTPSAEWFYVGHYGQLGPLTLEQITDLARDGVITVETFVWRAGMTDWLPAQQITELRALFIQIPTAFNPPPVPTMSSSVPTPPSFQAQNQSIAMVGAQWQHLEQTAPRSDKSRVTAGLLNLLPGIGRFYLGYAAHGILQLFTAFLCGIGFLWSIIDGIYILMGGVKYDGYGRVLQD